MYKVGFLGDSVEVGRSWVNKQGRLQPWAY